MKRLLFERGKFLSHGSQLNAKGEERLVKSSLITLDDQ
jgi:hypothetical protein